MGVNAGSRGGVVTASEIGEYTFCAVAWYHRSRGLRPGGPRLEAGTRAHVETGERLREIGGLERSYRGGAVAGAILLVVALVFLLVGALWRF